MLVGSESIHREAADAARKAGASFAKAQAAGFAATDEHERVLDVREQCAQSDRHGK